MAITLFTNSSAMSASNALQKANSTLATAMEHLGTGKRITKASDDAAGLQVATRLQGQTNGMAVAQRNIADASTMLQTGEGAMDEVSNIMYRMKDLATQGATDTNTADSRKAIDTEMDSLKTELNSIMGNTSYAGNKLFSDTKDASGTVTSKAKMGAEMTFQTGSESGETTKVDVSSQLSNVFSSINTLSTASVQDSADGKTSGTTNANALIDTLNTALDNVSSLRSSFGASINGLSHASANLTNMKDNTDQALGNIQDADFASEASKMTRSQMLAQTSTSMLKQSNSMSSLVMSILG
ncbi:MULTISPECIES: flagellin [Erwiniaceae]|uniref:flagellin N-terminal helical domain-containing protein n=1 Tax=Erwiniaceae TaxID=1903409 RepID=UPI000671F564|nr:MULTISPECIES: flagellin [Erwiniaceae]KMV74254.1 flagellin [bacteria symbiont BFo2 of Frankliniella occidentalis]PIJ44081.1 flagellin [Tatumella sp. OPLPL6]